MSDCNFCQLILALLFGVAGAGVLGLSYAAAMAMAAVQWTPGDYWLAWFAGIGFILGFVSCTVAVVSTGLFFTDLCSRKASG